VSKGYPSPTAALAAIVECLASTCDRVHVGSIGSGQSLECCPGCLLRVETAGLRVPDGQARSLAMLTRCQTMILDVVLNYRQCFTEFRQDGAKVRPIADLTTDGTALLQTWWDTLKKLACCAPLNQNVRFVSIADSAPEGGCAGWTMVLEVDVSVCACE